MSSVSERVQPIPLTNEFSPKKLHPFQSNKFKRRCPMEYFYVPIECPLSRHCNNGYCPLSHTKLEMIFHPMLHKTKKCKMTLLNVCNFDSRCTFYHDNADKIDAYLKWLDWKRNWNIRGDNFKNVLPTYDFSAEICTKISMMINTRDNINSNQERGFSNLEPSDVEKRLSELFSR